MSAWPAWLIYLIVIGLIAGPIVALRWRLIVQRVRGSEGRKWPTISATIDDFFVREETLMTRYGERVMSYPTTLRYVYHNPEIEIGEYLRLFDDRDEAQAWANSFKGCTVMIHVDPRNPSRSVLRKEDVDGATTPS
jgi:hypothetical protein